MLVFIWSNLLENTSCSVFLESIFYTHITTTDSSFKYCFAGEGLLQGKTDLAHDNKDNNAAEF